MQASQRVLGEEHPDKLTYMANLAVTYSNQGKHKEAQELKVQVTQMTHEQEGSWRGTSSHIDLY